MNETVMITVSYDMVLLDTRKEMAVDIAVSPRIAGILVHNRSCAENTANRSAITSIISGLSRLKGCALGVITDIRYAKKA